METAERDALVISCCMQKGGSAKTSTAVNLAAAFGLQGYKVLLVDLDPQRNATIHFGVDDTDIPGAFELLTGDAEIQDLIVETEEQGVAILPSNRMTIAAEKMLASEMGAETILRGAIDNIRDQYDLVLVDTPPHLGTLTANALTAADQVLLPVDTTSVFGLQGVADIIETVKTLRKRLNPELEVLGILACKVDRRNRLSPENMLSLKEGALADLVLKTTVPANVAVAEAASYGQSAIAFAPQSKGAVAYRVLADEILKRLGVGE